MQNYSPEDVWTLRPMCALCATQFPAGSGAVTLPCNHLFCLECVQESTCGQNVYQCPFERTQGQLSNFDQNLLQQVEYVIANLKAMRSPSNAPLLCQLINSLRTCVNYTQVVCRSYKTHGTCTSYPNCPYDHTNTSICAVGCPQGVNCRRIQACPYNHQMAPTPMNMPMTTTTGQRLTPMGLGTAGVMQTVNAPPMPVSTAATGFRPASFGVGAPFPNVNTPAPGGLMGTYTQGPGFSPSNFPTPNVQGTAFQPNPGFGPGAMSTMGKVGIGPAMMPSVPASVSFPPQGGPHSRHQPHSNPRSNFTYHRPARWYQPGNSIPTDLQQLSTTDKHFKTISDLFHRTSPSTRIVSIEVVRNYQLYTIYAMKHEAFSVAVGRAVTIKHLFHGTSSTSPKVIYDSVSGLDSRVGQGMWGQGTYYAVNSSYSVSYAHPLPSGNQQMFCCSVIVGDSVQLPSDGSLRKPPPNPSGGIYHSVQGNTGGSDIFITYEPAMSYPTYLITFTP